MAKIHFKLVTPQEQSFEDEVDEVYLTTPNGEIGILPQHENLMTKVLAGELRIKNNNKITVMAIGGGLLQMVDNQLSIMTDMSEFYDQIDEKIAEQAKARVEEALEQAQTDEEYATTLANLEKALAKIKVKRKYRTKI